MFCIKFVNTYKFIVGDVYFVYNFVNLLKFDATTVTIFKKYIAWKTIIDSVETGHNY